MAACSSTADLRKAELSEPGWLPGTYGNDSSSIAFVPIYAPFISDHVFFNEETVLRDGRAVVTSQRVVAFGHRQQIVQASYLDRARALAGGTCTRSCSRA